MKKKTTLRIMCGLARCGKSTWIKKHKGNSVIVCPDTIRSEIFGHQFHKASEDFVWAMAKSMTKLLLLQGVSVIIDATNLTYHSRGCWIKTAEEYGAKVEVIWIKTSLKECKRRNAKSSKGNKLPKSVLNKMVDMFENPWYDGRKIKVTEVVNNCSKIVKTPKNFRSVLNNYYQKQEISEIFES